MVHVEFVAEAKVEKTYLDRWTQECFAEPGTDAERLAHAVVSDFPKACEG